MSQKIYCKYCGNHSSSVSGLTSMHCSKHPNGANKGYHTLYEGSEKPKYTCKYCGNYSSTISGLTSMHCGKHLSGANKGYHEPAL